MDSIICEKLEKLKTTVENPTQSDVPIWIRETIAKKVSVMIQNNVSNANVVNELIGGLRAIGDSISPNDDDIIISQMLSIIDQIERGNIQS